jgi:hypothetical protein
VLHIRFIIAGLKIISLTLFSMAYRDLEGLIPKSIKHINTNSSGEAVVIIYHKTFALYSAYSVWGAAGDVFIV